MPKSMYTLFQALKAARVEGCRFEAAVLFESLPLGIQHVVRFLAAGSPNPCVSFADLDSCRICSRYAEELQEAAPRLRSPTLLTETSQVLTLESWSGWAFLLRLPFALESELRETKSIYVWERGA